MWRALAFIMLLPAVLATSSCCSASISGDPKCHGAHGDIFDVRGSHKGIYVMLTHTNVSMSVQMENVVFQTPWSKLHVNGSFVRSVFWVLRTLTGRTLDVAFRARSPHTASIIIDNKIELKVQEDARPAVNIDGIAFSLSRKTFKVHTQRWVMLATSTWNYPHPFVSSTHTPRSFTLTTAKACFWRACGAQVLRMNAQITATYRVCTSRIFGQIQTRHASKVESYRARVLLCQVLCRVRRVSSVPRVRLTFPPRLCVQATTMSLLTESSVKRLTVTGTQCMAAPIPMRFLTTAAQQRAVVRGAAW